MYQSDRFLEYAIEFLDEEVNPEAINEIRELRKLDESRVLKELKRREDLRRRKEINEHLYREQIMLNDELIMLKEKKHIVEHQLEKEHYKLSSDDPSAFDASNMESFSHELRKLKIQEREIQERLINNKERGFLRDREMIERKRRKKMHNNE